MPLTSGPELLAVAPFGARLRAWLDSHGTLMAAAEAEPAVALLEGRGRVARVPAPGATGGEHWVVRHYHRGGALARVLGDRYLRLGTPRPIQEFRVLEALAGRGVPAPAPIGAAVYRSGPCYRGDLVTRWIPDSMDLAACLFPRPTAPQPWPEPAAAMRAAGRLVRLIHEHGIEHPDLNLKNILLGPAPGSTSAAGDPTGGDPAALILDLDRAALRSGLSDRARQRMLRRFWRSARKWEGRTGRKLPAALRVAFEEGYAEAPAVVPASPRSG